MNSQEKESTVLIETNLGNIKIKLYNETPLHRDNFLKLVKENFYQDLLFHRVIKDFMIQGGDPNSRTASDKAMLGEGDLGYTIPAEMHLPQLFHKRGALSAARLGDDINPTKASSASQFYIVTGKRFVPDALKSMEKQRFEKLKIDIFKDLQAANSDTVKALYKEGDRTKLGAFREQLQAEAEQKANERKAEATFSDEQLDTYHTIGGTPHLDGGYTVFGEVIEGLDVVDMIQNAATGRADRPIENIRMKVTIVEE